MKYGKTLIYSVFPSIKNNIFGDGDIDGVLDGTSFSYSLGSFDTDKTTLGAWWKAGNSLYFLDGLMDSGGLGWAIVS